MLYNIKIEGVYSRVINYAMQCNHVPMVSKIALLSEQEYSGELNLRITTRPEFSFPLEVGVSSLAAETALEILPRIELMGDVLASLSERVEGHIVAELRSADGLLVASEVTPVAVLPFDEWSGFEVMPELTAAFVTPNNSAVGRILAAASAILGDWSGDRSINAYQTKDPNRARMQAAAIYASLCAEGITYCVPPASFEKIGQRTRSCDQVLDGKLATCFDLALLYASCLEAAGLNGLVLLVKGHAFAGVWLNDDSFSESIIDDPSQISKRFAHGVDELTVVELTALVAGRQLSFEAAETAGREHFHRPELFLCAVDITRARAAGIRPLPQRMRSEQGYVLADLPELDEDAMASPRSMKLQSRIADAPGETVGKMQLWERKLLDLSLRNSLLNFNAGRGSLPVLASSLSALENALAEGNEFRILEKPEDFPSPARSLDLMDGSGKAPELARLLDFEFGQKRLRSTLNASELAVAITRLYRTARVSLEENGANTLYLAVGFLKWYESAASTRERYAPLVLLPVELVRKSALKGYVVRLRDEEAVMNITLLEMLSQDFGLTISGLDPLPSDEKGVDLDLVFATMRQGVLGMPRWEVAEAAWLGIFSFSQFIMWNDLRNRTDELMANRVVRSLVEGHLTWTPQPLIPAGSSMDDLIAPGKLCLPIAADASQLGAVYASGGNNSFVLHGPPGTGKSQTITNIIANALYHGKRVLFVAEKMAALSVVERRLDAIGIGTFCLELHSNKSRKKDVLNQLTAVLQTIKNSPPEGYARRAEQLGNLRAELNEYTGALLERHPSGFSLYEAIAAACANPPSPGIAFSPAIFENLTAEHLDEMRRSVRELSVICAEIGPINTHPLHGIGLAQYSQSLRTEAEAALRSFAELAVNASEAYEGALELLGVRVVLPSFKKAGEWAEVCRLASGAGELAPQLLASRSKDDLRIGVSALLADGRAMSEAHDQLIEVFAPGVLELDAQILLDEWRVNDEKWLLPKVMGRIKVKKVLLPFAKQPKALSDSKIDDLLALIISYQAHKRAYEASSGSYLKLFPGKLTVSSGDWNAVQAAIERVCGLYDRAISFFGQRETADTLMEKIAGLALNRRSMGAFGAYADAYVPLQECAHSLDTLLQADIGEARPPKGEDWFGFALHRAENWRNHLDGLRQWCVWRKSRHEAIGLGLGAAIDALGRGDAAPETLTNSVEAALNVAYIDYAVSKKTCLSEFSGLLFEEKLRCFTELTAELERLARKEVFAKLAAAVPSLEGEAAKSPEMGILQRALRGGGRGMSIRKLFEAIPTLLPKLCPCMLMSPLSVAQYLDPAGEQFDLIVFDEASQLPTCKAVGAIARGKNVVVVGDPRQLPPTSFFVNSTSETEDTTLEDMESILDDCLALAMPQTTLTWHYRSRHESLIAFSNRQYYENRLLTFPSPGEIGSKVSLRRVEGSYDRAGTRQNREEAKAVVTEVALRLSDPEKAEESIGIVTFSSAQQNLIEDLLTELYKKQPELEERATSGNEPLFIKNLENVQGDERDVILFSVGYGPDKNGVVSLNFGPLNRDGGWRRLNVAVTRARREMQVFTCLYPEQLDATRTTSEGVAGLRAFIEYAQSGKTTETQETAKAISAPTLAKSIAQALEREGYQVKTNVGRSAYRIDVAVVHPQKPGEYILGILCDGSAAGGARSARDREIGVGVLKNLGWNLHRVWSLEYREDPARVISRIVRLLDAVK